jgi:hypothetical protein
MTGFEKRSCHKKYKYPTMKAAKKWAKHMNRKYHPDNPFKGYRCNLCGWYHIGHEVTPERAEALRAAARYAEARI